MTPKERAARLRANATYILTQRQHVVAAEMAVHGMNPERAEFDFEAQTQAVCELLQDIAQRLDEHACGLKADAAQEELAA